MEPTNNIGNEDKRYSLCEQETTYLFQVWVSLGRSGAVPEAQAKKGLHIRLVQFLSAGDRRECLYLKIRP